MLGNYAFPSVDAFVDRANELAQLHRWWANERPDRMLLIYGRRRAGKSYLFRRFAHGKPALLLVCREESPRRQLDDLAAAFEPIFGAKPTIEDVPDLIRTCFRAAREEQLLVVIDEFGYLLPSREKAERGVLTGIQQVIEEEIGNAHPHIVLCGSQVRLAQRMLADGSPLHGRLTPLRVSPLSPKDAAEILGDLPATDLIDRYAIAGGMPFYLKQISAANYPTGSLDRAIAETILSPSSALFDEPRAVLKQELRETAVYFGLVRAIAEGGENTTADIARRARLKGAEQARPYLVQLETLEIVNRPRVFGSTVGEKWALSDNFFRFWFRFCFPLIEDLQNELPPLTYAATVVGEMTDFTSLVFEELCRGWARREYGNTAPRISAWMGKASKKHPERSSEEIDIVGLGSRGKTVHLLGECKWTNEPLASDVLTKLLGPKLDALKEDGYKVGPSIPIVLASKNGFENAVHERAREDSRIRLVEPPVLFA
jgi:AAA+ ATPase superfamily predicted ATPase